MKINRDKPRNINLSIWNEKLLTVIERDILLVFLFMALGLLSADKWGARGLPLGWLVTGSGGRSHIIAEYFIPSLVVSIAIVAGVEIICYFIRLTTEPSAFRSSHSANYNRYANTYDDSDVLSSDTFTDIPDTNTFEIKDTSNYRKAFRKEQKAKDIHTRAAETVKTYRNAAAGSLHKSALNKKPAAAGKTSDRDAYRGRSDGKKSSGLVFILVIIVIIISFMYQFFAEEFSDNFPGDYFPDDNVITDDNDDYDFSYDAPFNQDEEFLQTKCEEAIARIADGDVEWLKSIGEGDAELLINMADWASADITEEYRYLSSAKSEGFIRYKAETEDGDFMIAFKFTGEGMGSDEDRAELTGISACSYEPWEKYIYDSDEYTYEEFESAVEVGKVTIGDDVFSFQDILTW